MPKITQEDINKTYKELKESCGGLLEDYFALIYLSNEFLILSYVFDAASKCASIPLAWFTAPATPPRLPK